jgi:hypothetical protein
MQEVLHKIRTEPKKKLGLEGEPTPKQIEEYKQFHRELDAQMYSAHKRFFEELRAENEPLAKEEEFGATVSELARRNKRRTRPPRPLSRPQDRVPAAAADAKIPLSRHTLEFISLGVFDIEIDSDVYPFEFIHDHAGSCFLTLAPPPEIKHIVLDEDCYDIDPPDNHGYCRVVGLRAGDCSVFMTLYRRDPHNHVIAFIA